VHFQQSAWILVGTKVGGS